MANLKNITELPVAESAEGLNLIVNDNGAAKQIAASAVGAQADFAVTDENSPAFIKNKPEIPAAQVQADWAEADETSPTFIKNKPNEEYDIVFEYHGDPVDGINPSGLAPIPSSVLKAACEKLSQKKSVRCLFRLDSSSSGSNLDYYAEYPMTVTWNSYSFIGYAQVIFPVEYEGILTIRFTVEFNSEEIVNVY